MDGAIVLAEQRKERLTKKIERLRKQRPFWIDSLIEPFAVQVAEAKEWDYRVSGPFGICCEVPVFFYRKTELTGTGEQEIAGLLQFVHSGKDVMLRDYTVDTGTYSPNSIGGMNGMNHPTIEIPDDADINWFLAKIEEFNAKDGASTVGETNLTGG